MSQQDKFSQTKHEPALHETQSTVEQGKLARAERELAAASVAGTYKVISPSRMVAKRFFRSRLSVAGLCMIIFVFLFSFLGPVVTNVIFGYGETEVFQIPRESELLSTASFSGADGKVYEYYDRSISTIGVKAPPSSDHILGTDTNGFDILVRLMYGGRISLAISFLTVFLELILGTILGGVAGYYGGLVDQIIMRIVDIFACLPGMPILLVLSSVIASIESIPPEHRIYYLMGFLTLISWTGTARLVRGQILSLREQEFMLAAETTGIKTWRRIFKHLIPNTIPQLIVTASLSLGGVILYESTLSYLGIGVPFPKAAWGSMIALADPSKGQEILANYPNMWLPAGVLIVITVLGFSFVGDGLRDAFDPRQKN